MNLIARRLQVKSNAVLLNWVKLREPSCGLYVHSLSDQQLLFHFWDVFHHLKAVHWMIFQDGVLRNLLFEQLNFDLGLVQPDSPHTRIGMSSLNWSMKLSGPGTTVPCSSLFNATGQPCEAASDVACEYAGRHGYANCYPGACCCYFYQTFLSLHSTTASTLNCASLGKKEIHNQRVLDLNVIRKFPSEQI